MDESTVLTAIQTGQEDALQWYALYQAGKLANTPATLSLGTGGLTASANPNTLFLLGAVAVVAILLLR